MSGHTKEPWYFDERNTCVSPVHDKDLEICAIQPIDLDPRKQRWYHFGCESTANASRIVACVNACAGVPNETLDVMAKEKCAVLLASEHDAQLKSITELQAQLAEQKRQNAELREANERMSGEIERLENVERHFSVDKALGQEVKS